MSAPEVRKLRLWQNRIETEVEVSGHGPPLRLSARAVGA